MDIRQKNALEEAFAEESESLFRNYYEQTKSFRQKCTENENFWSSNHWHGKQQNPNEPYPSVPALFSAIENVHAEIMDNYPEAVLLPCTSSDEKLAGVLESIVRSVLERGSFVKKYRHEMLRLLKHGACCFSVIWNSSLYGGYGDIDIVPWDIRYFLWDPSYDNIQDGKSVFKFSFHDRSWFKDHYSEKYDRMRESAWHSEIERCNDYTHDNADSNDIMLIERWYKKYNPATGRYTVQMAKLAGGVVLEWSEYDPILSENGVYTDGLYPFVVIPLYELEDTPVGMGMVDIFRSEQEYIDMLDRIILKNAMMSGKLRLLKDNRCNIPKEKLADWDEDVLEGSDISERSIRWFQPAPISPMIQEHLEFKISMLKKDSGQTELARGESSSSVTAASAILALQNAASKRTRNIVGRIYDRYTEIVRMILARISQFYDNTRSVRIAGADGIHMEYFDPTAFDKFSFYDFDVKVHAQKKNPYEIIYNNDIARELKELGVIDNEEMIDLMSFEGKDLLKAKLEQKKTQQKG